MLKKWRNAIAEMQRLKDKYTQTRITPSISVHRTLIYRALPMLYEHCPEAEKMFEPVLKTMITYVCRPDSTGDYEKGMGRHYYCGSNALGIKLKPSAGYYKNGNSRFSKSARTMMEEDYTMALTMWNAGFIEQGSVYLARAVHMLSDICCLPHSTRMTYYSSKKKIHQVYEQLARIMYPDAVPEQKISAENLKLFSSRQSFQEILNNIVEIAADEPPLLLTKPAESIIERLSFTERAVCALFYRFIEDLSLSPQEAHYVTDGQKCSAFKKLPPLTVKICEDGIQFILDDKTLIFKIGRKLNCSVFRAAHRFDGMFTLSPVNSKNGLVILHGGNKLKSFNPHKKNQLFSYEYHDMST